MPLEASLPGLGLPSQFEKEMRIRYKTEVVDIFLFSDFLLSKLNSPPMRAIRPK